MIRAATAGLTALLLTVAPIGGREPVNDEVNAMIRKEGREHSQILRTMHYLTDVYGPRLTGSPNHKAAGEWAIKEMTSWGMKNGALESFEWQAKEGWLGERAYGFVTAPYKSNLVFAVQPWTPSTNGVVTAQAVNLI